MLLSIFSSFDLTMSWMLTYLYFVILVIIITSFNMTKLMKFYLMFYYISLVMINDLKSLSLFFFFLKLVKKIVVIYSLLWMVNFLGLLPYVFSLSSHMMMTLSYVMLLWLGLVSFTLLNNFKSFLIHLLPISTPMLLCNFMVVIELVSQFIRPITLSVRLAANMTAGHILLILLSSLMVFMNFKLILMLLLVILELAVVFIQAYVFCVLLTMYLLETN